jgi:glycosyltransferase involved in cell wall biosynthesis
MQPLRPHIRSWLDALARAGLDARPFLRAALAGAARIRQKSAAIPRSRKDLWLARNPSPLAIPGDIFGLPSPVVSVSMVSRNRAYCIGDAIQSVQAQTFTDWQLIIIDDGSTDDTRSAVAHFAGDPRIRYVWQRPLGMAAARNHSLRLAAGQIIAYLDDDNLLYPDFLAAAVLTFSRMPDVDCLYGARIVEASSGGGVERIGCDSFERAHLLRENIIDMGMLVHRRSLLDRYGGIDENIETACDWDFALRITRDKPAHRMLAPAVRYRNFDVGRMSVVRPQGEDYFKIQRKWFSAPKTPRLPRVLFLLSPAARRDGYAETEARCMRRWGTDLAAWSEQGLSGNPDGFPIPIHDGSLVDAIAGFRPDCIHVHGLKHAAAHAGALATAGLPVTVWAPDFDAADARMRGVLAQDWIARAYCRSDRFAKAGTVPKLRPQATPFDTSLFRPAAVKDRSLVLQVSSAAATRDWPSFLDLARRFPEHHFVLAVPGVREGDAAVAGLLARWRERGEPGQVLIDPSRTQMVSLYERAGIYLHADVPADGEGGSLIAMPIAIAEAMATGAHILVPHVGPLVEQAGEAGRPYWSTAQAARLIGKCAKWSDAEWHRAWLRSVDRSFRCFADELVLRPLFDDWCAILAEQGVA